MLDKLTTEARNTKTTNLDKMSIYEILRCMNLEDRSVPLAVEKELGKIEQVVKQAIRSLHSGGRLIYMGAGTSGRLGVLDAVECVPTFSSPPGQVIGLIAGGDRALIEAVEGAEDDEQLGESDLITSQLTEKDYVIGIAASGRTPYVIGGLRYARKIGVPTASISCNCDAEISKFADVAIEVETGPEVLTGSTRLKAGTSQKMVLNMISTASMIGQGKIYKNLMVDVQPTNAKLVERSKRIIAEATGADLATAEKYYADSRQNVKAAIVMLLLHCPLSEALDRLRLTDGFIRKALNTENQQN
ncbi:N-acetylmuramic acid 6-phosphate etherase [Sporolactobacillus sp. THM19-2]|uniref:N-acetylmuramic acid 6-phosphate etherase n=1 Tax=Sporolactobacillus sp. THM19-2 TaxID=2511171 RepID=UPI00101FE15E|nr:N-acetylmuramic acid 6-phosphate etherase [Sporolactobacillus sp. THM19-2]RYL94478.1 N-acetylmuramic acid 6-phosphate etherase [Sporolactobacillus sp. THM19-2]